MNSNGYVYLYMPEHPDSTSRGFILEHRYVMEKTIGRRLKQEEIVHHINRVKTDNRPENLMLLDSISQHRILHEKEKEYYLDTIIDDINKMYESGCGAHTIAKKLDTNKHSILRVMKKHGMKMRPPKKRKLTMDGYKWCNVCERELRVGNFYRNNSTYDGYRNRCIECTKKEVHDYYVRSRK